ncbi:hypothetical protein U1Q18_043873 [Sarracenia purpurea var. burkii]
MLEDFAFGSHYLQDGYRVHQYIAKGQWLLIQARIYATPRFDLIVREPVAMEWDLYEERRSQFGHEVFINVKFGVQCVGEGGAGRESKGRATAPVVATTVRGRE